MAKAKKLASGNWRTLVYVGKNPDGSRHYESFTAPTKKESEFLAAEYALQHKNGVSAPDMPLGVAMDRYIDSKSALLSPPTIRSYRSIRRNRLKSIIDVPLKKLNLALLQEAVNADAREVKPKTLNNVIGLLTATLNQYAPKQIDTTNLTKPAKQQNEIEIPDEDAVARALLSTNDRELKTAIILASCLGLRRSEICGLTWKNIDLKLNKLSIRDVIVKDEYNHWVTKNVPKTDAGYRTIPLPDVVAAHLLDVKISGDPIVSLNPDVVSNRFSALLRRSNIPHFKFHSLRHYNASIMLALGIPDKYAMELIGHSTPDMLKRVYQHTMASKRQEVVESINNFYNDALKNTNF